MGNSVREQTLKQLRALQVDLDAIHTSEDNIHHLEQDIIRADRDAEQAEKKLADAYRDAVRQRIQNIDPEKEAAKAHKKLSPQVTRKKYLIHLLAVAAIALVWLIAGYVVMNQQLLPDVAQVNVTVMLVPRIVYVIGMIAVLLIHLIMDQRKVLHKGCLIYSVPAVFAAIVAMSYSDLFANVLLLRILDIVLGVGVWILALFAPSPNSDFLRAVEEQEAKKKEALEKLDEEAKTAYAESRYENDKNIIPARKNATEAKKNAETLRARMQQEKAAVASAEKRLKACPFLDLERLPSISLGYETDALRKAKFAIDHMVSAVERGRADTLEEALENWLGELARRGQSQESFQKVLNLTAETAARNDAIESANRHKLDEADRERQELQDQKDKLDRLEKQINK